MTLEIAVTSDVAACLALRRRVFIQEQNVPEAEEMDDLDAEACHLLARLDGIPVGTARIFVQGARGKIGRVCVLADHRGAGLGRALMEAAIGWLRIQPGITHARISAQTQALGFYQGLGFCPEGAEYPDAGIPHRDMVLRFPHDPDPAP